MGAVSYDAEYSFKPLQTRLKIDAGGLGGMQDRFDSMLPPTRIADISRG